MGSKASCWPSRRECLLILSTGVPAAADEHELARLVNRDANEMLGADYGARLDGAADLVLGAAAPHLERSWRVAASATRSDISLDRPGA